MTAYYNENDEFAAAWLRNLIKAGLIANGEVDTRSIVDVRPGDLVGFTQCHFFAGIGGWSYALRKAGWDDSRPAWTGSCPCQPFSLAGAQRGFADERHLWPVWRDLVEVVRPPVVFGEQVASATEWLGLVRGDLEAMGYAVGALPIQAASAGADHLRDRYWFVADAADARPQGRRILSECAGQWIAGADGLANADSIGGQIDQDARGSADGSGPWPIAGPCCARDGDMGLSDGYGRTPGESPAAASRHGSAAVATGGGDLGYAASIGGGAGLCEDGSIEYGNGPTGTSGLDWVIGADGKARRVKPGIRLLAHGIPARVGKLRGFGNAIDPRPAAAFIEAYMTALSSQDQSVSQTVDRGIE